LNTTKLLWFHMHYICFWSWGPFFTVVHTTVYCEKFHSLTVKKLSFGINFCSVSFQNILEQILTSRLFKRHWSWLKRFLIFILVMRNGALWKQSKLLTHYSGGWGPLWKQSTYTVQLLLGLFESKLLTHYSCYWGPFWKRDTVLAHYSCYWGPIESRLLTHCNCCWTPFWKQSTSTSQLLLVGIWKQSSLLTHKTVAVGGPFENRAPALLHITVVVGGPFEGIVGNYDVVRKTL